MVARFWMANKRCSCLLGKEELLRVLLFLNSSEGLLEVAIVLCRVVSVPDNSSVMYSLLLLSPEGATSRNLKVDNYYLPSPPRPFPPPIFCRC